MWILLAALVTVVTLFLAIPVEAHLVAEAGTAMRGRAELEVSWFFGWVSFRSVRPSPMAHQKPPAPKPAASAHRSIHRGRRWWPVLRTPGFFEHVAGFVLELARLAWPKRLALDARVGLDDPADTAIVFGAVMPVAASLARIAPRTSSVRLAPVFEAAMLWGHLDADFRVRPVEVLWTVARYACSGVTLRALWASARPSAHLSAPSVER